MLHSVGIYQDLTLLFAFRILEFETPTAKVKGRSGGIDVELWDCSGDHKYEAEKYLFLFFKAYASCYRFTTMFIIQ